MKDVKRQLEKNKQELVIYMRYKGVDELMWTDSEYKPRIAVDGWSEPVITDCDGIRSERGGFVSLHIPETDEWIDCERTLWCSADEVYQFAYNRLTMEERRDEE